ncbi:hypothetical protein CW304_19645 [Bacillus sp. UFRGS-B20]|nr:hypothetical protein CW304_19645 [Bacillus sp. UFRGS-B20]
MYIFLISFANMRGALPLVFNVDVKTSAIIHSEAIILFEHNLPLTFLRNHSEVFHINFFPKCTSFF